MKYFIQVIKQNGMSLESELIELEEAQLRKLVKKPSTNTPNPGVMIDGNTLVITEEVMSLFKADIGYKVYIFFTDGKPYIQINNPESGFGNLIRKNLAVSFRGENNTKLSEFGTHFKVENYNESSNSAVLVADGTVLLVDNFEEELLDLAPQQTIEDRLETEIDNEQNTYTFSFNNINLR